MHNLLELENYNFNNGCFVLNNNKQLMSYICDHFIEPKNTVVFAPDNIIDSNKYFVIFSSANFSTFIKSALRTNCDIILLQDIEIQDISLLSMIVESGHTLFLFNCKFDEKELKSRINSKFYHDLNNVILKHKIKEF